MNLKNYHKYKFLYYFETVIRILKLWGCWGGLAFLLIALWNLNNVLFGVGLVLICITIISADFAQRRMHKVQLENMREQADFLNNEIERFKKTLNDKNIDKEENK
jgi:ABC-type siderophore export system fused ATPase/permease subunit